MVCVKWKIASGTEDERGYEYGWRVEREAMVDSIIASSSAPLLGSSEIKLICLHDKAISITSRLHYELSSKFH